MKSNFWSQQVVQVFPVGLQSFSLRQVKIVVYPACLTVWTVSTPNGMLILKLSHLCPTIHESVDERRFIPKKE